MKLYVALNSVPDYNAPAPSFKSVHETLEGAIAALYPDSEKFQKAFVKSRYYKENIWIGPDGFGEVREVELLP